MNFNRSNIEPGNRAYTPSGHRRFTGALWGALVFLLLGAISSRPAVAQLGLWSSAEELAAFPMAGPPWERVLDGANQATSTPDIANQNDDMNGYILAAAIVFARTGIPSYRDTVVAACSTLVAAGLPDGEVLAWSRETGAYALAADLVGYRTPEFEDWLFNMAEVYIPVNHARRILDVFDQRPNNWGSHAFGTLCAIYAYLQDTTRLTAVRDYWILKTTGPQPPALVYGSDRSWHPDTTSLRMINPKDSVKEGLNIDGIWADDMRRNGVFSNPPPVPTTSYHWEALQGVIMAARVLERVGQSIWNVSDNAIYRSVYALQVRWENEFGGWKATGDDLWMLPFLDAAYGTDWTKGEPDKVWGFGKNAGWGYVVWDPAAVSVEDTDGFAPISFHLAQNHPNPFNPTTTLRFDLPTATRVRIGIYDVRGRLVATLQDGVLPPGPHSRSWNAATNSNERLTSGVYLARLNAGAFEKTIKMILLQ